ncbi:hypothetical protein [Tropicimonas sp. IMCC34011]|uniref:hypothetical protein n=1 Tax=Tropicimonas sp. IMCC34011 TaxID=2248759 RepID=UPI000E2268BF|nr:hypothetical protein [Tropicimonas sp. IMCC34011]
MFHRYMSPTAATPAFALHVLFEQDWPAYRQAAELLAGRRGGRLVDQIVGMLEESPVVTRRTRLALSDLLDILALERVEIEDSEEAALFAMIDPQNPVVEDICLLTDRLREALELADQDHPPAPRNLAAA